MAEYIKTNYLEKAYEDALVYANGEIENCNLICKAYTKGDVFYQTLPLSKLVVGVIAKITIATILFVFKGIIMKLLNELSKRLEIGYPKEFANHLIVWSGVTLMLCGVIGFMKIIYTVKMKADFIGFSDAVTAITKEIDQASKMKIAILESLHTNESLTIDQQNQWNSKLLNLTERLKLNLKRSRWLNRILSSVMCMVAFAISLVLLPTYIADSLCIDHSYTAVLVVFISYAILNVILYEALKHLFIWYKKVIKPVLIVLFLVFQGCVLWSAKGFIAIAPFYNLEDLYQASKAPEFLNRVMEVLSQYILNKGFVILLLISYISIMMLIRTDIEKLIQIKENGFVIPMLGGPDRLVSPKQITASLMFPMALAFVFVVIAPYFMSYVLINGASFLTIMLYLILGFLWFWISRYFRNEINRALHGKQPLWIKNAFLLCYMLLTISFVQEYGIGSVALILVQSLLAVIAYGYIVSIFTIN